MSTWNIDAGHSEIGFKVKHLVISTVKGKFTTFEASITGENDSFETAAIAFSADTASIDTNSKMRDDHLKSAEFFDVTAFPKLTFTSKSIAKKGDAEFAVVGDLTMHGVTKEVTLSTTYNGETVSPYGVKVRSFDISGTLHRSDFGLTWNAPIETGGVAVSDEVKLDIIAEFTEAK